MSSAPPSPGLELELDAEQPASSAQNQASSDEETERDFDANVAEEVPATAGIPTTPVVPNRYPNLESATQVRIIA